MQYLREPIRDFVPKTLFTFLKESETKNFTIAIKLTFEAEKAKK